MLCAPCSPLEEICPVPVVVSLLFIFLFFLPGNVSLKCPMLHLRLGTVRDQKEEDTEEKEEAEDMRYFRKSFKFGLWICPAIIFFFSKMVMAYIIAYQIPLQVLNMCSVMSNGLVDG